MANRISLARPYARAIFAEALEGDTLGSWRQRLDALAEALDDASLRPVVRSKVIAREAKLKAMSIALGADAGLTDLAGLLVKNDRLELAGEIAAQFAELVREHEAKQKVTISTPHPLSEEDLQTLSERLSSRIGKRIEIDAQVDSSLLAGVRISGQGWLIEGNMRAQLAHLARQLLAA